MKSSAPVEANGVGVMFARANRHAGSEGHHASEVNIASTTMHYGYKVLDDLVIGVPYLSLAWSE